MRADLAITSALALRDVERLSLRGVEGRGVLAFRRNDDRELRAAVGTVLGPDAATLRSQHAARDREPHAGPRRPLARCGAAIEAIEQVRQIRRRDPRTAIADADGQAVRPDG